jgi:hypothetical protein
MSRKRFRGTMKTGMRNVGSENFDPFHSENSEPSGNSRKG